MVPAETLHPPTDKSWSRQVKAHVGDSKTAFVSSLRSVAAVNCSETERVEIHATGVPAARRTSFLWLLSLDEQGKSPGCRPGPANSVASIWSAFGQLAQSRYPESNKIPFDNHKKSCMKLCKYFF
jgi:hypothetical protein